MMIFWTDINEASGNCSFRRNDSGLFGYTLKTDPYYHNASGNNHLFSNTHLLIAKIDTTDEDNIIIISASHYINETELKEICLCIPASGKIVKKKPNPLSSTFYFDPEKYRMN